MWTIGWGLMALWLVLKFALHKGGYIHIVLLSSISILVIQVVAYRKTRFQRDSTGR